MPKPQSRPGFETHLLQNFRSLFVLLLVLFSFDFDMAKPTTNHSNTQHGFLHKKRPISKSSAAISDSSSKINKRIRDIKRLLAKPDLSLQVKVGSERRLIQLKYLYGERKIDEKEKEMAKKYHGLKHIEKQKVARTLKKIRQRIDKTSDEKELAELEQKLKEALIDEAYIKNFPKTVPYAALFATNEDDGRTSKKQEIREQIKHAMENGDAFDDLQRDYRQKWRATLIKQGVIEDATPVMVEDNETQETTVDTELKDDFFE
ncbi:hypothetical protein BC941DRAFT_413926 [Chlamydoabsidia padenii]|nr:hypothetical protein BC941DRAFT_413926 [Chlamydoabsidia padenii]